MTRQTPTGVQPNVNDDDYVNAVHFMHNFETHFITCIFTWLTVCRDARDRLPDEY